MRVSADTQPVLLLEGIARKRRTMGGLFGALAGLGTLGLFLTQGETAALGAVIATGGLSGVIYWWRHVDPVTKVLSGSSDRVVWIFGNEVNSGQAASVTLGLAIGGLRSVPVTPQRLNEAVEQARARFSEAVVGYSSERLRDYQEDSSTFLDKHRPPIP